MAHEHETKNAKLIITIVCIIALVILALGKLFNPDFEVDIIVYAIIAGVLFGVGGVRELFGAITPGQYHPPEEKEDTTKKRNRKRR